MANKILSFIILFFSLFQLTASRVFADSTGIMIPLYTYPGTTWTQVISAKQANPSVPIIAIVNPSNGPGSQVNSNYVSGISNLRAAGVKVLGYTYTDYGSRDPRPDIDKWANFYTIDGIFFDEMEYRSGSNEEQWYRDLSLYAKNKGYTLTVGNPGADTLASYVGTVDIIMIYERSGLPTLTQLGGWHSSYDKSNFSIIPYGVPTLDLSFVQNVKNLVGYIYITNDVIPNPWDSLPPYFNDLVSSLATSPSPSPIASPSPSPSLSPSPSPTPKPGDANGDNAVDGLDFVIWLNHYNPSLKVTGGPSIGDFNNSMCVDGVDYVIWINNY